jgi:KipI family sensor histidine kinase inhibitor
VAAEPTVRAFGEAALLVELAATPAVHALDAALRAKPLDGVVSTVPGLESLLIAYDPLRTDLATIARIVERRAGEASPSRQPGRHRSIPVVYGGELGPDLEEVARLVDLSADEVVATHTASDLRVLIDGFAPGFAYLGDLPFDVPRLETPRTRTPAGSVAVAGRMSGIYPAELPGGWRVIGRTPVTLFDPRRDPPAYLAPGDVVRFEAVSPDELERRAGPVGDW